MFENSFLKELSALTQLTQKETINLARTHVDYVLTMFNDDFTPRETAFFVRGLRHISVTETPQYTLNFIEQIRRSRRKTMEVRCS